MLVELFVSNKRKFVSNRTIVFLQCSGLHGTSKGFLILTLENNTKLTKKFFFEIIVPI